MTFVSEVESAGWFEADSSTVSVTCADGDVLVASAACGNQLRVLTIDDTAGGGGLTWTLHGSVSALSRCSIAQWTAVVGAGQGGTFDVTASFPSAGAGGLAVQRHVDVEVGAHAVGDAPDPAAPSLDLATTADGSTIVVVLGDHETVDGSTRTWRTGAGALTETTYFRSNSENAAYSGYHADAGTAGSKTVGLTLPSTMRPSIAAVELTPAAGGDFELPLDPAAETSAALPLGAVKTRAAGTAAEADAAQPLGRTKALAAGAAAATEEARPLGRHKTLALGTATESATAGVLGAAKTRALGTATERDTAVAIAPEQTITPTVGGNGLQVEEITARLVSFVAEQGVVEDVNGGDIRHMLSGGLRAGIFVTDMTTIQSSGLAVVSVRLEQTIRLYERMQVEPSDVLDVDTLRAVDAICNAIVNDFTIDGIVRQVDVLGAHGQPLRARPGFLPVQEQECRIVDVIVPLICDDVWILE
jgi:hypothetical protein